MKHHADFFDPALWQASKDKLLQGELPDFFPYDASLRFSVRYPARFDATPGADDAADDAGDAQRAA
jgi:isocitrate dehydrogenase kinase/phosphatase